MEIFPWMNPVDLVEQQHECWLDTSVGQFFLLAIFYADVSKKLERSISQKLEVV